MASYTSPTDNKVISSFPQTFSLEGNQTATFDKQVISESPLQIRVFGSYDTSKAPKGGGGDALHSFQSRSKDKFGGRMNDAVILAMYQIYDQGINPFVKSMNVSFKPNSTSGKIVEWEVILTESPDGKAYVGFQSRGGAGNVPSGSAVERALKQAEEKKKSLPAELDEPRMEFLDVLDYRNDAALIRQIFWQYTMPKKYPALNPTDKKPTESKTESTTPREKIDSTFTFNVEKENTFVIVSTGTFSVGTASSGIASEIGELMIVDDSEIFVFQDDPYGDYISDEFQETDFYGEEEQVEYLLQTEFGDSEGTESNDIGVEVGNGTATDKASSAGGSGQRKYQKSMTVNGNRILNGELPDNLLKQLTFVNRKIEKNAANALEKLNAAYKAKFGNDLPISDGYRNFSVQNKIFDWNYHDTGINPFTKKQDSKGNGRKIGSFSSGKPQGVNAAKPGTSKHGWGQAIDISGFGNGPGNKFFDWMEENARKYGWINPAWAKKPGSGYEPWHWEYNGTDLFKTDNIA